MDLKQFAITYFRAPHWYGFHHQFAWRACSSGLNHLTTYENAQCAPLDFLSFWHITRFAAKWRAIEERKNRTDGGGNEPNDEICLGSVEDWCGDGEKLKEVDGNIPQRWKNFFSFEIFLWCKGNARIVSCGVGRRHLQIVKEAAVFAYKWRKWQIYCI